MLGYYKEEQIVTMNFIVNKEFEPGIGKERNVKTIEIFFCAENSLFR